MRCRTEKHVAVLALGLTLNACAAVGPNFVRPQTPAASGYLMAGDAESTATVWSKKAATPQGWWRALGSPELDAVMVQALRGNQTLAEAIATLQQSRAETQSAEAARRPDVTSSASATRDRINTSAFGFSGFPSPTVNLFSVGTAVSYDLDLAGGRRRSLEAAGAALAAQEYRVDAAYLTLTGNIALQAVRIASLRDQIAAIEAIASADKATIEIDREAERVGGFSVLPGLAERTQLARDQALLPALQQDLAQARHALALLVGRTPAAWAPPDFSFSGFSPPAEIPVSLPSAFVRHRPDILAAEADLHADTARIGVVKADFYPDIKLSANFSQLAVTPGNLFGYGASGWSFGPSVTVPVLGARTRRARLGVAEAEARAALARYNQTVLAAFKQVADVLTAVAHDEAQTAANTRAEAETDRGLRLARQAFEIGGVTRLQVVEADRLKQRARLARIESEGQKLIDIVELYLATADAGAFNLDHDTVAASAASAGRR